MKAKVTKRKNARGRIVGYTASLPYVKADGTTPSDAVSACEDAATRALARLDRGTRVFFWRDCTIVVSPDVEGWRYWIWGFREDYFVNVTKGHDGPHAEREDAEDAALGHLAQNLWNANVDDTEFVKGLPVHVATTLGRWIRFQREYIKAEARGLSGHEAHRAACEAS